MAEGMKPRSDDALVAVSTGTVIWLVVGGVLLVLRDRIPVGSGWWLGTCAVAVISGVGGILFLRRRRRRLGDSLA